MPIPVPAGELIIPLAEAGGWSQVMQLVRLKSAWGELMGDAIGSHSTPERIGHGRLTVRVDSSPWLAQLGFFKDEMQRRVNGYFGESLVAEVFLMVGRPEPKRQAPKPPRSRPVSQADLDRVEELVGELADPEVRQAMRHLLLRDLRRGRRPPGASAPPRK